MAYDRNRRLELLGSPRILIAGDLVLERDIRGTLERISPDGPFPLLHAEHREERLAGAGTVAAMLRALGVEVRLLAGVGRDKESRVLRRLLAERNVDDRHVLDLDGRPTTILERLFARTPGSPRPLLGVEYGQRRSIPAMSEALLHGEMSEAIGWADLVLIADEGHGLCTPTLVDALVRKCRGAGVLVLAGTARRPDDRYRGVHGLVVSLQQSVSLEHDRPVNPAPDPEVEAGRRLVETLGLGAVLIVSEREGLTLVHADARVERFPSGSGLAHDPLRAGHTVLAVAGLSLAGGTGLAEAASLSAVMLRLAVEKHGSGNPVRQDVLKWLGEPRRPAGSKTFARDELAAEVGRRRRAGQKIVFTNGCFDLLHPGHVRLLRQSAALGDYLIVGVNSDASVGRLKGPTRPLNHDEARCEVLAGLESVDAVTVFDEDTPLELINAILPDVLVKGGDYTPDEVVGRAEVEAAGGNLVLIPLVEGHSTTGIVRLAADREVTLHDASPAPAPHTPTRSFRAIPPDEETVSSRDPIKGPGRAPAT